MPSAREMRLRIRSVKNIGQVTRALQAVSASKVRRAMAAYAATHPYAEKAWKVLVHLVRQPGHNSLHPLLNERPEVKKILVIMITSDRGLAGASNMAVIRNSLDYFKDMDVPVEYVTVGKKGRDIIVRRRQKVMAEFNNLPSPPSFLDVSAIGRLVVNEYLDHHYDQVYLAYNEFHNMLVQKPIVSKLLPVEVIFGDSNAINTHKTSSVFIYEPDQDVLLDQIVPRFTALQVYQAILSAQASEHAARMMAMRNATDNAAELVEVLTLDYNKARQQTITNDLLDIASGAEAMAQASQTDLVQSSHKPGHRKIHPSHKMK